MFLESLLETSGQAKRRRGWATLTSFLLEAAAVGLLILLPMLYTNALPNVAGAWVGTSIISPPRGESGPPEGTNERHEFTKQQPASEVDENSVIHVPPETPKDIFIPKPGEDLPPGPPGGCVAGCVPGATGDGPANPVTNNVVTQISPRHPEPQPSGPVQLKSSLTEGMLIRRVQPVYPQMALIAHMQGTVVLRAIIGRDGVIRQIETLSGPPLLVGAAVDAVRQWRYRPYLLGGQPVEVETQVTVNFVLNR